MSDKAGIISVKFYVVDARAGEPVRDGSGPRAVQGPKGVPTGEVAQER